MEKHVFRLNVGSRYQIVGNKATPPGLNLTIRSLIKCLLYGKVDINLGSCTKVDLVLLTQQSWVRIFQYFRSVLC